MKDCSCWTAGVLQTPDTCHFTVWWEYCFILRLLPVDGITEINQNNILAVRRLNNEPTLSLWKGEGSSLFICLSDSHIALALSFDRLEHITASRPLLWAVRLFYTLKLFFFLIEHNCGHMNKSRRACHPWLWHEQIGRAAYSNIKKINFYQFWMQNLVPRLHLM